MKSFQERVLDIVKAIPSGKVLTYGAVAQKAGNAKAVRAVGNMMAKNTDKTVPCHRVIKTDGTIGMYNGLRGTSKEDILRKEGVDFLPNKKVFL